jgi:VWFA-related protein
MRARAHRVLPWSLSACLALASAAQTAKPPNAVKTTPSPTAGQPQYTLRERVPILVLDVSVTDSSGYPVHGLRRSDFTIFEDKDEVTANSFEEHRSDLPAPPPMGPKLDLAPNTFSNYTPGPARPGPINILLLDSLNIPTQDQGMVHRQMLDFVGKMRPGTRVAVLGLSTHLFVLQGLTTDPELLKAAITSNKILPAPSTLEDPWRDLANINPSDTGEQKWLTVDQEGEQSATRAQYEITGMNQIARYLSGMPGRKNLLWFTGSFSLQFPPMPDDEAFPPHPHETLRPEIYDFDADLKSATDSLSRAHVTVYPIDGHGLEAVLAPNTPKWAQRNIDFMNLTAHGTMDEIAEQTGGKAFYNTNGFVEAVEQAIDDGSNYYTLSYTPTNQALDIRFRKIKVEVDQPNLHLVYRPGYYAVAPETSLSGAKAPKVSAMQAAMMRGGLEPTQILFKVKVTQAPGTEASLPGDNQPNPGQMKPPYRRYSLAYIIGVANMAFTESVDGNYRGAFEYGVRVYNADGDEVVNAAGTETHPILPPPVYQSMLRAGANAHLEIDVPAKGDYFLRIAVHDLTSDRVGAIEIPTASILPDTVPATAK